MQIEPAAPFAHPKTQGDLGHLESALRQALAAAGRVPRPGRRCRLLNLACGRADENGVLARVFGEGTASLELVCSDLREREIAEARARWDGPREAVDTRFIAGDATRLFDHREIEGDYDVVFLRHQNFWNGPKLWSGIFDRALHHLAEDGILVITSYFDREHDLACAGLEALGARRTASVRNPFSRPLADAPAKSVDRHLAVFRRDAASRPITP